MWRNHPKEYEVLLKKGWNILQLTAYRCADCRVIIINEDDCQYKFHYAKIESLMFYLIVSLQNKKITINKGADLIDSQDYFMHHEPPRIQEKEHRLKKSFIKRLKHLFK